MPESPFWYFAPFHLDVGAARLWHGSEGVRLTAKAWGVLHYLVAHAGQVVRKEDLFTAVWDAAYVSDAALAVCIHELRQALGDLAQTPQYVETVRGRGYRFVAPVTAAPLAPMPPGAAPQPVETPGTSALLVEREAELAQLWQRWAQARQGTRQLVVVTGEAGIGKTTLVDAWVAQMVATEPVWVGRGQCIEQHGAGEPYLPLLEALGRLARGPDGARLIAVLQQQAPSWLVHLPALVSLDTFEALQRRVSGTTRERMLRELAEAVEVLSAERPLVLVLEDLHWSDGATLDWLAYIARRRDRARLLVLGTSRPTEAMMRAHSVYTVTQELQRQGHGAEISVGYVSAAGVATYLTRRLGSQGLPDGLPQVLHQRTHGNPLFLVTMVDDLIRQGGLQEGETSWALVGEMGALARAVPESLRHLIERQVEQLSHEEQELLEVASVAGVECPVAAMAAGVLQVIEDVEARCAALARRGQFLQARGTTDWPDGTVTAQYGFRHALYHEVVYARVPVSRRARWHRQIGARLEAGYGPQARARAAELAEHFVRGRDTARAVPYLGYAGEQAAQRSAHEEALVHLTKGLALLATLPATPAQAQHELALRMTLGPVLIATQGQAAPEVEQTYARTRALCAQVGETAHLVPILRGLGLYYRNRGALRTARALGEQLARLAQREAAPTPRLDAHAVLGSILFYLGEYRAARTHVAQGLALSDPVTRSALVLHHGEAPGVACLVYAALTLWCLGYPAQAVQRGQDALTRAQALGHPYSLAVVQHLVAVLHYRRRDAPAVQAQADTLLPLATAQGFPLFRGWGACWRGWALAMQGQGATGLAQLRQGMEAVVATGQTLSRPLCLLLRAEAAAHTGQGEAGQGLLAEALAAFEASERGDLLAEAYRLQGALVLRQATPDVAHAEAWFQQALALARRQQAKSLELRAALSLSRLWQQHGKRAEASALLAPIYGWFAEGFDTADLQEAKALLDELEGKHGRG